MGPIIKMNRWSHIPVSGGVRVAEPWGARQIGLQLRGQWVFTLPLLHLPLFPKVSLSFSNFVLLPHTYRACNFIRGLPIHIKI